MQTRKRPQRRTPRQTMSTRRPKRRAAAQVNYKEPGAAIEDVQAPDTSNKKAREGADEGVGEYRRLLVKQKKELYKDPPCLPPSVRVLDHRMPQMSRGKDGKLSCPDYPEFKPNLTPAEVMQRGSFGGTYFRSIESAVTGVKYDGNVVYQEFPSEWFEGLNVKRQVTSSVYRPEVNKYRVSCGGSLGMYVLLEVAADSNAFLLLRWESAGWISSIDPYGWFHWYCRFYLGRRSSDDDRQVSRWLAGHGAKGRFRSQLYNKIISANTHVDDENISPVIRQTCQHWGYVVTQQDLEAHKRRVKKA